MKSPNISLMATPTPILTQTPISSSVQTRHRHDISLPPVLAAAGILDNHRRVGTSLCGTFCHAGFKSPESSWW